MKVLQITENLSSHINWFISGLYEACKIKESYPRPLAERLFHGLCLVGSPIATEIQAAQIGTV